MTHRLVASALRPFSTQSWLPTTAPAPATSYPVLTPGQYPYLTLVSHGVLDRAAQVAYTSGQCHALAYALHDRTAWPVIALLARSVGQKPHLVHIATAPTPDTWFDIDGPTPRLDLLDRFLLPPGTTQAFAVLTPTQLLGLSAPRNALGIDPLPPPDHPAARSMVTPLLSRYPLV